MYLKEVLKASSILPEIEEMKEAVKVDKMFYSQNTPKPLGSSDQMRVSKWMKSIELKKQDSKRSKSLEQTPKLGGIKHQMKQQN